MQSAIWEGGGFLRRRGRGHNCRERGLCAISLGVGLLVAMVLLTDRLGENLRVILDPYSAQE